MEPATGFASIEYVQGFRKGNTEKLGHLCDDATDSIVQNDSADLAVFFRGHTGSKLFLSLQQLIDFLVKVRNNLLSLIEFYILRFGLLLCLFMRDKSLTLIGKDFVSAESQEFIDAGGELFHCKRILSLDEVFNVVELTGHGPFQTTNVFLLKVVFGNGHV